MPPVPEWRRPCVARARESGGASRTRSLARARGARHTGGSGAGVPGARDRGPPGVGSGEGGARLSLLPLHSRGRRSRGARRRVSRAKLVGGRGGGGDDDSRVRRGAQAIAVLRLSRDLTPRPLSPSLPCPVCVLSPQSPSRSGSALAPRGPPTCILAPRAGGGGGGGSRDARREGRPRRPLWEHGDRRLPERRQQQHHHHGLPGGVEGEAREDARQAEPRRPGFGRRRRRRSGR